MSESERLAREIQELCLSLIDDLNAEAARDGLYDHPACQDVATHGREYHPATVRYDQHGCGAGFQCDDCAAAARDRFAAIVDQFGYATCTRCRQRFTGHAEFATVQPVPQETPHA